LAENPSHPPIGWPLGARLELGLLTKLSIWMTY
jgi:hypothetical protein